MDLCDGNLPLGRICLACALSSPVNDAKAIVYVLGGYQGSVAIGLYYL